MGRQKRSANTYQKINTIFYRDTKNVIMPYDGFVTPELEWVKNCKFECSEKVDGTNIRFEVKSTPVMSGETVIGVEFNMEYKGKTDNAVIPPMLLEFLKTTYTPGVVFFGLGIDYFVPIEDFEKHKWGTYDSNNKFTPAIESVPAMYTIYGEGYGVKIQKCGGSYLKDSNKMIGFDVKVTSSNGKELYLLKQNRDEIFNRMHMPIVPTIGYFTINEAIKYVKKGFVSLVAENDKNFKAEGLVCKSPCGLRFRNGERMIFKVKTCDWDKYYSVYGTYDKVEQKRADY